MNPEIRFTSNPKSNRTIYFFLYIIYIYKLLRDIVIIQIFNESFVRKKIKSLVT